MSESTPPAEIPGLSLEEMVSRTNLSEVWKGTRRSDSAAVAVKFPRSPAAAAALGAEAATVKALEEALIGSIVPTEFAATPVPHLVMPWKGRRTYRDVLQDIRSGDDRARAMQTLFQVIFAVAAVQREGFIHGDLKPENILIGDNGSPWLIDFGMARAIRVARLDSQVSNSMDQAEGGWGGTLHYLPPEGLHGEPPTPSWDVYACGVMIHEVLLGGRPDRAATPEQLRAALPSSAVDLLLSALAWSAADRTPSVPALLHQLVPVREQLTAVGSARQAQRFKRAGIAGLAACFVLFRYASVLALLASYAALAYLTVTHSIFWCLLFLVILRLHFTISWEGPESGEEYKDRQAGMVQRELRERVSIKDEMRAARLARRAAAARGTSEPV